MQQPRICRAGTAEPAIAFRARWLIVAFRKISGENSLKYLSFITAGYGQYVKLQKYFTASHETEQLALAYVHQNTYLPYQR
ncbi:hypothetical protein ABMC88_05605 [Sulfitobacter sp. HNIBRBA2951]|uniref:hypothetical protein n=1 Tax=Sulfitobacter aquimarinus TaxID=3158557 RepID=UPI0032DFA092